MAAVVQSIQALAASATTISVTIPGVQSGSTLLAFASAEGVGSTALSTSTGPSTLTWTEDIASGWNGSTRFHRSSATVAGNYTVSWATGSAAAPLQLVVVEAQLDSPAVDVTTKANNGTASTTATSAALATTIAHDLIVAATLVDGTSTLTGAAGYTLLQKNETQTNGAVAAIQVMEVTATGSQSAPFVLGTAHTWGYMIAAYRVAPPPPVAITGTDAATGAEATIIAPAGANDAGTATDTGTQALAITGTDAASGSETMALTVAPATDAATGAERTDLATVALNASGALTPASPTVAGGGAAIASATAALVPGGPTVTGGVDTLGANIDAPTYLVEMAIGTDTTSAWHLGRSQLDVDTHLLDTDTRSAWQLDRSRLDIDTRLIGPVVQAAFVPIRRVRQITIKRGRQDELGIIQAGTCTVIVDNSDGRLSPDNQTSPYYPNVLPMRRIRVTASWRGVLYPLYSGFVEAYVPLDNGPADADIRIDAVDWYKWAALAALNTGFPAQDEGARIGAVIDQIDVIGLPRALDTGPDTLLAAPLVQTPALQHIQDVTTAERGIFFVTAGGTLTYHNRRHRLAARRSTVAQATFGQADPQTGVYPPGVLPYARLDYELNDRWIYNDIRVHASKTTEAMQEAGDATSQQTYGPRTLAIDSPVMGTEQAQFLAAWLLSNYKDPRARVRALTVNGDPAFAGDLWPQVLGREIADRLRVQKAGPGRIALDQEMWIEGVQHDIRIDRGGHTVTWSLGDVRVLGRAPWVLDQSQLDQTTILAY